MKEFIRIIISVGGHQLEPRVNKLVCKEDDYHFTEVDHDFKNFEEYCTYMVEEQVNDAGQAFVSTIVLTEEEFEKIKTLEPELV